MDRRRLELSGYVDVAGSGVPSLRANDIGLLPDLRADRLNVMKAVSRLADEPRLTALEVIGVLELFGIGGLGPTQPLNCILFVAILALTKEA